jgi:excisionase family DNA binding protein
VHPVTLRDWTRAGRIPAYRIGREYRYDPAAIADWLQEREISRSPERRQRRLPAFYGIQTKKAAQTSGLNVWLAFVFVVIPEPQEAVTRTVRVHIRCRDRPRWVVAVGDGALVGARAGPRNVEGS